MGTFSQHKIVQSPFLHNSYTVIFFSVEKNEQFYDKKKNSLFYNILNCNVLLFKIISDCKKINDFNLFLI